MHTAPPPPAPHTPAVRRHGMRALAAALLGAAIMLGCLYGEVPFASPVTLAAFDLASPPCPAPPCDVDAAPFDLPARRDLRLTLDRRDGPDIVVHFLPPAPGSPQRDPYPSLGEPGPNQTTHLFACPGYSGPLGLRLTFADSRPGGVVRVTASAESFPAALAESLRIALPVLALLALLLAIGARGASFFVPAFLAAFVFYTALAPAPKSGQLGDNRLYAPTALQLARRGSPYLEHHETRAGLTPQAVLVATPQGRGVNYYPAGVAFALWPLAAASDAFHPPEERLAETAAKLCAAASVALFGLICARLGFGGGATALWMAIFALGTGEYSVHAGGLFSHNLTTLFSLAAVWLLVAAPPGQAFWLALACAAGLACRHDFVFVIVGCLAATWRVSRRKTALFAALLALLAGLLLVGWRMLYGRWLPPYMVDQGAGVFTPAANLATLAGLLLSPNRGLLVFCPVLALGLFRAAKSVARPASAGPVDFGLGLAVTLFTAALTTFGMWWGGWSYGPRLFLAMLGPLMVLTAAQARRMLAPGPARGLKTAVFAVLVVWGMLVNAKGALVGDDWNGAPADVNAHPERLWDARDTQIGRNADLAWLVLRERLRALLPPF